jgi:hypothetical protein
MKTNMIISWSFLLRMKDDADKHCREKQNTYFMFNNLLENCAVYEIIWKNAVEPDRPQRTIWHMRTACGCLRLQTHTQNM